MAGEADAADPTELAGVAEMGTEAVEAWSLDDADEDYPLTGSWSDPEREDRWTPRRITVLAVVVSALVAGIAVGVTVWRLREGPPVRTTKVVVATSVVTTVVPEPAPPPKLTARAAPPSAAQMSPPPPPPIHLTELDYLFMQKVRGDGFTGSTDDLIRGAAKVCYQLQHGRDLPEISQDIAAHNDVNPDQAHLFASEVFLMYPTCHP